MQSSANQRIQENPKECYSQRDTYEVSQKDKERHYPDKFNRDSFHNNLNSLNIMFDEIEHTTALNDLLLSNRSGAKCMAQFKLDSCAGANLLQLKSSFLIENCMVL